jgi:membrane fusion protein (multidrug efflux system)
MRILKRHPLLLCFVCAIAVLALLSYKKTQEEPSVTSNQRIQSGPTPISVETVGRQLMADQVESVGTTGANESIDITAKVAETLSKIHFEDGAFVQKGDLLVELTNAAEASRLAEAQASANDAHRQLTRLEELFKRNMVASTDLDVARTAVQTADARLEGVMVNMDDRLVRAPFTGLLGFRNVSEGSLISPGTIITTLDDISVIKLDFTIPEVYLADIKVGQKISANSVVYRDQQFEGEVSVVGSRVDPVTRSVVVRAIIDNQDATLRPGMLLTVSMDLNEHEALVVPEESVIVNQDQQFVMVVDGDTVRRVEVTLGQRRPGVVEVLSGLTPGERIVTEGVAQVRPGQPVTILVAEAS